MLLLVTLLLGREASRALHASLVVVLFLKLSYISFLVNSRDGRPSPLSGSSLFLFLSWYHHRDIFFWLLLLAEVRISIHPKLLRFWPSVHHHILLWRGLLHGSWLRLRLRHNQRLGSGDLNWRLRWYDRKGDALLAHLGEDVVLDLAAEHIDDR